MAGSSAEHRSRSKQAWGRTWWVRISRLAALLLACFTLGCQMEAADGSGQRGPVNTMLAEPLRVLVTSEETGEPAVGALVDFTVTQGGGRLSAAQVETDELGYASVSLTLGPEPGLNEVVATFAKRGSEKHDAMEVVFRATAFAAAEPASVRVVSGDDQSAGLRAALPEPLVLEVLDAEGEPAGGVEVVFRVKEGAAQLHKPGAKGEAPVRVSELRVTTDGRGRAETSGPIELGERAAEVVFEAQVGELRASLRARALAPVYDPDVKEILARSCVACHRAEGLKRDVPLESYAQVMQKVRPFDETSRLLQKLRPPSAEGSGAGSMWARLTGDEEEKRRQYQVIVDWVLNGAFKPAVGQVQLSAGAGPATGGLGGSAFFSAQVRDEEGDAALGVPVRWSAKQGEAAFASETTTSDAQGLARVQVFFRSAGEVVLEARVEGAAPVEFKVAVSDAFDPRSLAGSDNPIDQAVLEVLKSRGTSPPEAAADAAFLRRVSADLVGRLPTPDEVEDFAKDSGADKRSRKIDELLASGAYGVHWRGVLGTWLQLPKVVVERGEDGERNKELYVDTDLHARLTRDQPLGELVGEVIREEGVIGRAFAERHPAKRGYERSDLLSLSFGGTSVQCARCHDHKFDDYWTQDRARALAAFFEESPAVAPAFDTDPARVLLSGASSNSAYSDRALRGDSTRVSAARTASLSERLATFAAAYPQSESFKRGIGLAIFAELQWPLLTREHLTQDVLEAEAPELVRALAQASDDLGGSLKGILRLLANSKTYQLCADQDLGLRAGDSGAPDSAFRRHHAEVLTRGVHSALGLEAPLGNDRVFDSMLGRPSRNHEHVRARSHDTDASVALVQLNYVGTESRYDDLHGSIPGLATSSPLVEPVVRQLLLHQPFAKSVAPLVEQLLGRAPTDEERAGLEALWSEARARNPDDLALAARQAVEDVLCALGASSEFNFR